jgi:hypothetical protein
LDLERRKKCIENFEILQKKLKRCKRPNEHLWDTKKKKLVKISDINVVDSRYVSVQPSYDKLLAIGNKFAKMDAEIGLLSPEVRKSTVSCV